MSVPPYMTLIDAADLSRLLSHDGLVVVDCRFSMAKPDFGRNAYEAGHIPGARFAHLNDNLSSAIVPGETGRHPLPAKDDFAEWLGAQGITPHTQVVAYDSMGGAIASRLWWLMRWLGHEKVAVLNGGWKAWEAMGGEISQDVPAVEPQRYPVGSTTKLTIGRDDACRFAEEEDYFLIDARSTARFAGRIEPIDPVAGHIPGALNRPWTDNLDAEKKFKPRSELKAYFESLFGEAVAGHVGFYCGSGVTACHNLLALSYATGREAALYPGSWSEWIIDPNAPIEKD